jgi:hypothetical protein
MVNPKLGLKTFPGRAPGLRSAQRGRLKVPLCLGAGSPDGPRVTMAAPFPNDPSDPARRAGRRR